MSYIGDQGTDLVGSNNLLLVCSAELLAWFAGPPAQVFALLNNDKVFLVDIRPEEQREEEGLPELKLGARLKVAAFPVPQVRG
jgi:hypothetical protein